MRIDSTVESLNKLAEQSRAVRARFEHDWYLNLAFFLGDQWVYWNRGRLDKPQVPKHRLLITDNRIMPTIQTRVAKKTKQRPIWTVTPNSPEDSDISSAELGELVMQEKWKSLFMHDRLNSVLHWSDICCAGFWKVYWDDTLGESAEFLIDESGQPIQDQNGRLMRADSMPQIPMGAQTKKLSLGDVCLDVRSPFEILPDPLAESLSECEWLIEETVVSEEYMRSHHGVEMEGDTEASPGPTDGRTFATSNLGGSGQYKGIKRFELWATKSSQHPNGKRMVWAKNEVVKEADNPYDELPYVMFQGVPVPGRFWPTSIVTQLRGPQIELNKIKSQIRENAQRIGNPALLKSRLANVKYSGVPGEEVLYDDTTQNAVPTYLEPPSMPPYVIQEIERIEHAIREISGQHEVSSSQVPAGVTAASAINLLLEQDDTRLGPAIADMEESLSRAGQMVLKLVARYYTEERTIRLAGEDGDWDIRGFKGDMLRDNTGVEVQAGSTFPASKAAKQAAMQQALTLFIQNGIPLDARAMRKFFRDFQVGGLEHLFADMTEDVRQVKRENRLMYQGQPIPINSFDNDELHITAHEEEMKSARFWNADPQAKMLLEQHVSLHRDRLVTAQEKEAEEMFNEQVRQAQLGLAFTPPPPKETSASGSNGSAS